ncbi:hypothetical protein [Myroides marinus]|uniref:hypothetical protein n=1 Tax=Myroides marinus TaxID=703342 RepID=UPI002577F1CD|nr:hypothetical protein [Myroides marinus]MDM1376348.1 hypothetical protein [Myroides marinus]MDM1382058.1 hypothetical protein [Myroides marinus]
MNKLYLFGIGGTGSRVIKALTMLLACGIDTNKFEIVPIIVDPDASNGDVTRTVQLLKDYDYIRKEINANGNVEGFFKTHIEELSTGSNYKFGLGDTNNKKFGQYINLNGLDSANEALVRLLFSEENLDADMQVGFKGNPNIGSVVLNRFIDSEEFHNLANGFKPGDRIFIISSIFGGTGAAGFPLLLKNIRNVESTFPNYKLLQDAPIGAVSVLPYFNVTVDDDSSIDGATFVSKAKAALSYYDVNVSGNNSLNSFYYIADSHTSNQLNNEGGVGQKNQAHFVELASALAIVDFCKESTHKLDCMNGQAVSPIYKEFGVQQDKVIFGLENLAPATSQLLNVPLSKFTLFALYVNNKLKEAKEQNWAKDLNLNSLMGSSFYNHLSQFINEYKGWLNEMGSNQRTFLPYNMNVGENNLFEFINGYKAESSMFDKGGKSYGRFDFMLSKVDKDIDSKSQGHQRFVDLFYAATEELIKTKYNF